MTMPSQQSVQRLPAEVAHAEELAALARGDDRPRPAQWRLSPQAVVTYLMGGTIGDGPVAGTVITPKYVGNRRLIETAVATLATDRALLLLGVPGTAKSWVAEHLAAAISGDSTRVVQCTAGTDETQVRYGWNYAQLLAHGPSRAALVPTPLLRAMENGTICRLEELTRMSPEVQDTLITVLSEQMMPIPELDEVVHARRGFTVVATANNRDKGVNEMSAALKRRFTVVVLPLPATAEEEVDIVRRRVADLGAHLDLPVPPNAAAEIARVVGIFRELRGGRTDDGTLALKTPSGTLSTAEAIGVMIGGLSQCHFFGDGRLEAHDLAPTLLGAVVKDPVADRVVLEEYLETVLRRRPELSGYYHALAELA